MESRGRGGTADNALSKMVKDRKLRRGSEKGSGPNHFHLVLWPRADQALSKFMQWLTLTHAQRWHACAARYAGADVNRPEDQP